MVVACRSDLLQTHGRYSVRQAAGEITGGWDWGALYIHGQDRVKCLCRVGTIQSSYGGQVAVASGLWISTESSRAYQPQTNCRGYSVEQRGSLITARFRHDRWALGPTGRGYRIKKPVLPTWVRRHPALLVGTLRLVGWLVATLAYRVDPETQQRQQSSNRSILTEEPSVLLCVSCREKSGLWPGFLFPPHSALNPGREEKRGHVGSDNVSLMPSLVYNSDSG